MVNIKNYMHLSEFEKYFLFSMSYFEQYFYVLFYFLALYFLLGPLFLGVCRALRSQGILEKIVHQKIAIWQLRYEVFWSFKNILIFAATGIPIVYLLRRGIVDIVPNSLWNVVWGLLLLSLYNEVHFYLVHKLLHKPFFFKRVHYVHHRSKVPTIWSVFSMHWFEGLLLSLVPLIVILFVPLAPLAIVLYPMLSILLNFSGHCNYRFGKGKSPFWLTWATRHNAHHHKKGRTYGFALPLMDKIFNKKTSDK